MVYLLILVGTSIFCLAGAYLLKIPFFKLTVIAVKQMDTIFSPSLDEEVKDKLILKNLFQLLFYFFQFLFFLIFSIVLGALPILLYQWVYPSGELTTNPIISFLSMIIGSCVLLLLKPANSNYSYWSKLLHTIILDNYNVGNSLFKWELKKMKIGDIKKNDSFVIVTGLARAGTTALTNLLYTPEFFHSINYSNVPFLLAPNTWKKIYNPTSSKLRERAHGDKVLFSETSIEAFEEYFFKVLLNDSYIDETSLDIHQINSDQYFSYQSFQELYKTKQTDSIYLAKNNNFLLRLKSIRQYNQHFKCLIMFRAPLEHANSLKKQNENFVTQQTEDPFVLKYMTWLGHYEFGLNQKVLALSENKEWTKYSKDSLNYWLAIWINYYQYVLTYPAEKNTILVHYDDLSNSPDLLKEKLANIIGVNLTIIQQEKFVRKQYAQDRSTINEELLAQANTIYRKLIAKKLAVTLKTAV